MIRTPEVIAAELRQLRCIELQANLLRTNVEAELIQALHFSREHGSQTFTLTDGVKVTLTREWSYKADFDAMVGVMPLEMVAPIRTKTTRELDVSGYEWYRVNHPNIFATLAQHVVATPRKVGVTIKEPKNE